MAAPAATSHSGRLGRDAHDLVRAEQAACDGGGHVAAAHVHPVGVDGEGDLVRVKVGARVCLVRVRVGRRGRPG